MKQLKLLHIITGLLTFALVISGITNIYQPSSETADPTSPTSLLLLMAALINLMGGAYISKRIGINQWLQIIGSLLIFSGLATAIAFVYNNTLMTSGATLDQITLFSVSTGTLFHVLASLNIPFPAQPKFTDTSDRETGFVKWFNASKGFGFITRDVGDDVFVHYRAIRDKGQRTLSEGQRVEFIVVEKDKGLQAEDVITTLKGR